MPGFSVGEWDQTDWLRAYNSCRMNFISRCLLEYRFFYPILMEIIPTLEQLLHSIKCLTYTNFRLEDRVSGVSVVLLNSLQETVYELKEPVDASRKAKLRHTLEDYRWKVSHKTDA